MKTHDLITLQCFIGITKLVPRSERTHVLPSVTCCTDFDSVSEEWGTLQEGFVAQTFLIDSRTWTTATIAVTINDTVVMRTALIQRRGYKLQIFLGRSTNQNTRNY